MSRRRVSVKELGVVDCQGWLHRRKDGRSFLVGSKWKKYWFVLKKSALYWYRNQTADKAEGFIDLSGFTIEASKHSRRKHTITASHPLIVTILMAAESFTDMNKWISKMSEAAKQSERVDREECYSEDSNDDSDDCSSLDSQMDAGDESSSSILSDSLTEDVRGRSTSTGSRNTRRKSSADSRGRLSWLDLPRPETETRPLLLVEEVVVDKEEKPPDEMESLYQDLKAASLSPMGRSGQKDFRASFIRRCRNEHVNEKLHLLRILTSTLKAKESELSAVDQILDDSSLTAPMYRTWKISNVILLQDISQHNQAAGGAAELRPESLQKQTEHSDA